MGLYREQILPRVIDRVADTPALRDLRTEVCSALSGEVLEVGFGSGLNVAHYPDSVDSVTAVDPATVGRRLAAGRLAASRVPVAFADLDGDRLPLGDHTVDEILVTLTLCTIPDVDASLAEMRRVLRPGGTLRFFEHGRAPDAGARRWQKRLNPLWKPLAGGCNLDRAIDEIIRRAGFAVDVERRRLPGGAVFASMYVGTARPI
ncbi:MAG: class I SAM-dependent methyltransferase [Acidimicrobiales bacterium]